MFGVKEWKKSFLPKIIVIDPDIWLTKPTENDNEDLKWFFNQTCDALAFYHSSTIYVRDDAFTVRIILHEMGHWIIHKWLHSAWKLQDWWDHHSPFAYHMVRIAIKVGMISRKEIYEICKEKKEKC
jgi:hypothetical protein